MVARKKLARRAQTELKTDAAYSYLKSLNKGVRQVYSYPANGLPNTKGRKTTALRTSFMVAAEAN